MSTQWQASMGGAVGLRYEALPVACQIAGVALTPEVGEGVAVLEAETLEVWRNG